MRANDMCLTDNPAIRDDDKLLHLRQLECSVCPVPFTAILF